MITEYRIHHMQRSGGHAFAQWLTSTIPEQGRLFINDFVQTVALRTDDFVQIIPRCSTVISTIEDCNLSYAHNLLNAFWNLLPVKKPRRTYSIVLVRSPINLFASRHSYQHTCLSGNTSADALHLWTQHAQAALHNFHPAIGHLTGAVLGHCIQSPEYIQHLAHSLDTHCQPWPQSQADSFSTSTLDFQSPQDALDRSRFLPAALQQTVHHLTDPLWDQLKQTASTHPQSP